MSKTGRTNHRRADREAKRRRGSTGAERRITVRSETRTPPDLYKLSRAVIAIAMADAEAEKTAASDDARSTKPTAGREKTHDDE
ncbi:hypothetical protein [Nocardia asteroides]|uniref:hypothetical protein n=1 Tax=Nocardia asteroides TaxID=1824 RepID=UPI001E33F3A5|nr:hypothetical protein [Nocardia asteroides]UGT62875.1 hypothetical protein LTT61_05925 [Nocardia asteroides]